MIRRILLGLFLIVTPLSAFGQNNEVWDKSDFTFWGGIYNSNKNPCNIIGYDLDYSFFANRKWSVGLGTSANWIVYEVEGMKAYEVNATMGLTGGYSILNFNYNRRLEAKAGIGTTFGGKWNFMYVDAGIRYYSGTNMSHNTYLGIGAKYFHSYNSNFDSKVIFCISMGVSILDPW